MEYGHLNRDKGQRRLEDFYDGTDCTKSYCPVLQKELQLLQEEAQ
jgi:hypothetical protein